MPLHERTLSAIEMYQKKFVCLKKEDAYISGNYDSETARNIRIKLERCMGKDYCKSQEYIDDFITNKYLVILKN